jgi:anti-anti-sigma factor
MSRDDGMKVTREDHDGIPVITLTGEFDSFETELVRTVFEECLGEDKASVVFNLGPMTFANSTTIAYFITAQRQSRGRKGRIALAEPQEMILKALTTLGLQQVFPILDSVEEAVVSLKSD